MKTEQDIQDEIAALKTQLDQRRQHEKRTAASQLPGEETRLQAELAAAETERDRWRQEVNRRRRQLIGVQQKIARARQSGWLDSAPPVDAADSVQKPVPQRATAIITGPDPEGGIYIETSAADPKFLRRKDADCPGAVWNTRRRGHWWFPAAVAARAVKLVGQYYAVTDRRSDS